MRDIQQEKLNKHILWENRIQQQKSSGKSIRQFCKDEALNLHVFHYWATKSKKTDQDKNKIQKICEAFLPIQIKEDSNRNIPLLLEHCSGFHIKITSENILLIKELLISLSENSSC